MRVISPQQILLLLYSSSMIPSTPLLLLEEEDDFFLLLVVFFFWAKNEEFNLTSLHELLSSSFLQENELWDSSGWNPYL